MSGKPEETKVKLFLYLIGTGGREVYETLQFGAVPNERTLAQVIKAFDDHCDPKKSETVERYKFFTRFQEQGESLEKFMTELRILAATCNFEMLHDSLLRARIICGILDSNLREELLKEQSLDLTKCIQMCRAAELSKARKKTIETNESIHGVRDDKSDKRNRKSRSNVAERRRSDKQHPGGSLRCMQVLWRASCTWSMSSIQQNVS